MAAFGAIGEYAIAEYPPATVVMVTRSDTAVIALLDEARRFDLGTIGTGEHIGIGPEDRTIIVLPDDRDLRPGQFGS
jgi:hypothetical protein